MILKPSAIYTFFKSTLMLPGWGGERARKAAGVNTHLWMYRTDPSAARTWDERAEATGSPGHFETNLNQFKC